MVYFGISSLHGRTKQQALEEYHLYYSIMQQLITRWLKTASGKKITTVISTGVCWSFCWDLAKQGFPSVDTDVKQTLITQQWLRLLCRTEVLGSSQVWCRTARFLELPEPASFREWFVAQCWRHSPPSLPTHPHLPHPGNLELTLAEPPCDLFRASLCCLSCSFCCLEGTWAITRDRTATGCLFSKRIYQCPQRSFTLS